MPEDFLKADDRHKRLSMRIKNDIFYEMSVNNPTSSANVIYAVYMILCVICGLCCVSHCPGEKEQGLCLEGYFFKLGGTCGGTAIWHEQPLGG